MVSSLLSSCPVDLQLDMSSLHARNWSIHVCVYSDTAWRCICFPACNWRVCRSLFENCDETDQTSPVGDCVAGPPVVVESVPGWAMGSGTTPMGHCHVASGQVSAVWPSPKQIGTYVTLGPACKAQVEERRVYLGPIEISSDLGLSTKGAVIEHPY